MKRNNLTTKPRKITRKIVTMQDVFDIMFMSFTMAILSNSLHVAGLMTCHANFYYTALCFTLSMVAILINNIEGHYCWQRGIQE